MTDLLTAALAVAQAECDRHVREVPPGSNRGPDVEKYLKSVGLGGGYAWCAAFAHWCFDQASAQLGVANPMPRTAGVLDLWRKTQLGWPARVVTHADAVAHPDRVRPGMVFVYDHGHGEGHVGIVKSVLPSGHLVTIEGNSNVAGAREGVGVFELSRRSTADAQLLGFLDFSKG